LVVGKELLEAEDSGQGLRNGEMAVFKKKSKDLDLNRSSFWLALLSPVLRFLWLLMRHFEKDLFKPLSTENMLCHCSVSVL